MIKVPYDNVKFYYVTNHYDVHLSGTCIHNGKLALFETVDETDYEEMTSACPCCQDGGNEVEMCTCEVYKDLYCFIIKLPWYKRVYYRLAVYGWALWFIKHWGLRQGMIYWRRWKYHGR